MDLIEYELEMLEISKEYVSDASILAEIEEEIQVLTESKEFVA